MRSIRAFMAATLIVGLVLLAPSAAHAIAMANTSDPTGDTGSTENDITNVDLDINLDKITVTFATNTALPALGDGSWSREGGPGRSLGIVVSVNDGSANSGIVYVDGNGGSVYSIGGDRSLTGSSCYATPTLASTTVKIVIGAHCFSSPGRVGVVVTLGDLDSDNNNDFDVAPANGDEDPVPLEATVPGGYWLLGQDGGVFSFGTAGFYGSTGDIHLNSPIVGLTATPARAGYRFVGKDGGVFTYGDASFHGSMGGSHLNSPIVGIASTHTGDGYWLVAADGGIFAYGDAAFHGSMGGSHLNSPIVGMTVTPSGDGYWMVAADGGIFAFGDAPFYGSMGDKTLNKPVVGISTTSVGYYLVTQDGGVFSFGDANFYGTDLQFFTETTVIGIQADASGYRIVGADGSVKTFGNIFDYSDVVRYNLDLNSPIIGTALLTAPI